MGECENRILATLEDRPSLTGHFVTPESETFVEYVSNYYSEIDRLEKFVDYCASSRRDSFSILSLEIQKYCGSSDPAHRHKFASRLSEAPDFATMHIVHKVARLSS